MCTQHYPGAKLGRPASGLRPRIHFPEESLPPVLGPGQRGWGQGCKDRQVLPSVRPGRRRQTGHQEQGLLSPRASCQLTCEGFWTYHMTGTVYSWDCRPSDREGIGTREWPGPTCGTFPPQPAPCGPRLHRFSEAPRTSGHTAWTDSLRVPRERRWHPPWGNESPAGCSQDVKQAVGRFSRLRPSLAGLKVENHSDSIRC